MTCLKIEKYSFNLFSGALLLLFLTQCHSYQEHSKSTAEILGNPAYGAISYGGYRHNTRAIPPSIEEIKEDMKILAAMKIKLIRTYNTQLFGETINILEGIKSLKKEDPNFEMYVMLGAWIECEGAYTPTANHQAGNIDQNTAEIKEAVKLAQGYPDIIKIIAVGNEAMVHWATSYYVNPKEILYWVNYLQTLKKDHQLPPDLWITSSDNFESWGGGNKAYHQEDLIALIKAVDFVSIHTYPFHDSFYNPSFWGIPANEVSLTTNEQIIAAMQRASQYAQQQYYQTTAYIKKIAPGTQVHIGETGWATMAASSYGKNGSQAADEWKQKLYYQQIKTWTNTSGITSFFFEAFDEQWKDQANERGSENHFGLFTLNGEAKHALWDLVDDGVFDGLYRSGQPITKTYHGALDQLIKDVLPPPLKSEIGPLVISTVNKNYLIGEPIKEETYVILKDSIRSFEHMTYPSAPLKLNAWEGSCTIKITQEGLLLVHTGKNTWWGTGLEIQGAGKGENLSLFDQGYLHFDMKGDTHSLFNLGFQTGSYSDGSQVNNFITIGPNQTYKLHETWQKYKISIRLLNKNTPLNDVTSVFYLMGINQFDGKSIYLKNIYLTQK